MHQHPGNENGSAVEQSSGSGSKAGLAEAFAGGGHHRVGWFRFHFDEDRWEWSPEVEKMHGYLPGSVTRPPRWCWRTSTPMTTGRSRIPSS